MKYYQTKRNSTTLKANMPDSIIYSALDVNCNYDMLIKCNPTDVEHSNIITTTGNSEILFNDVITKTKELFGNLYSEKEIIEWRDKSL